MSFLSLLSLFFDLTPIFIIFGLTIVSYFIQYQHELTKIEILKLKTEILELQEKINSVTLQLETNNSLINSTTNNVLTNQDNNTSLTIFLYVVGAVILISCTFYFISYLNSDIYSEILLKTVPNHINETSRCVLEAVNNNSLILGQELDTQLISLHSKLLEVTLTLIKLETMIETNSSNTCNIGISSKIAISALKASQSQW
jgi:hypothetical protein